MPATITDDGMDMSSRDGEHGQEPSTSYRLYSTNEFGSLRVSSPPEEGQILLAMPAKKKFAVHKMARGVLADGTQILALARHNGQIDVVDCTNGKVLTYFSPKGMREDIHRWVGLAVATDGIFSCTSAGSFVFTPLTMSEGLLTTSAVTTVELPEPLQIVVFEPEIDPKFFAFGGEEVPLSVWDLRKAISTPPSADQSQDSEDDAEEGREQGNAEMSSRQKKRKRVVERRARAREYKWGEIWRAKNLPNDATSLAQTPRIISIAFLEETKLAVGSKDGMLRLYEVGTQRKCKKEVKLFHPKTSPVKLLVRSHNLNELVATDITGRVYVVNWRSATTLYKYEIFSGAVLSLCSMPPAQGSGRGSRLATASAEKLLRLHSMPVDTGSLQKSKENGKVQSTKFCEDGVMNLVWDGDVPMATPAEDAREDNDASSGHGPDEEEEEDDIWQGMAPIDDEADEHHRPQRRRTEAQA